jgi:uncharacterized membrane protein YfcA
MEIILVLRYRRDLNLLAVWPIALTSIVGIPIGVWALKGVNENTFLCILGVVIAGYALYALLNVRLPELRHPLWAYAVGFLAGMLGGAYNTSGPPVIVYGNCRGWSPAEFKGNLQGFFVINSAFVVVNHALQGNLTSDVWKFYVWTLPFLALAILIGTSLDRYLDPERFRKVVLILLVLMGVRLIFSG